MVVLLQVMPSVKLGKQQVVVQIISQSLIGRLARYLLVHPQRWLQVKRKKIIAAIEQQILEEHAELHGIEQQNARAYYSGLMDGLGFALKLLKPTSSVISLTSVWYDDEPTQTLERDRERVIELHYVDMEDPEPVGLFETAEAQ
jgi:hypothetical protein